MSNFEFSKVNQPTQHTRRLSKKPTFHENTPHLEKLYFLKNLKPLLPEDRSLFNLRKFTASIDEGWIIAVDPQRSENDINQCTFVPVNSAKIIKSCTQKYDFPVLLTKRCVFTFDNEKYLTQHLDSLKNEFEEHEFIKYIDIVRDGNTVTISSVSDVAPEKGTHFLLLEFTDGNGNWNSGVSIGLYFGLKINPNKPFKPRPSYYAPHEIMFNV